MEPISESNQYKKAKKRVAELKKFYSSLSFYIIFIVLLAALNYYSNQFENMWFLWAAFGWGIGIFFHAIKVFNFNLLFGRDWEERKVQEFMDRDTKENDTIKF